MRNLLKKKNDNPIHAQLKTSANEAYHTLSDAKKTLQTERERLQKQKNSVAELEGKIHDAEQARDFAKSSNLKRSLATLNEAIQAYQMDEQEAVRAVSNAKSSLVRAERNLFSALFDEAAEKVRDDMINLTGLYRLSLRGDLPGEPYINLVMKQLQRRLNIRDQHTAQAATDIKMGELGR